MPQLPVEEMDLSVHTTTERVDREAKPYADYTRADQVTLASTYGFTMDQLADRNNPTIRVLINLILAVSTLSHRIERLETLVAKEFDLEETL